MPKQIPLWERISGKGTSQQVRQIPDLYVLVDDIDYDAVSQHCWRVFWKIRAHTRAVNYVAATIAGKQVLLRHFILSLQGIPRPQRPAMVGHFDRDPLNNTRNNIRVLTRGEVTVNRGKQLRNQFGTVPTSSFKGVSWHRVRKTWRAISSLSGTDHYLGSFLSENEAAHTVNLFYAAHHPTVPRPNPTVLPMASSPSHCSCKLCKPQVASA